MFEKQVDAINEFARTRLETAQEAINKVEGELRRLVDESMERFEPGRERLEALLDSVRDSREDLEDQVSERVERVVNAIGLPTATQLEDLNSRVEKLARKVNKLAANGKAKSATRKRTTKTQSASA